MKRSAVIIFLLVSVLVTIFAFRPSDMGASESAYLRVHIRADSNAAEAQAVKYQVRDAVVGFLTPTVASSETKAEAMKNIAEKLPAIEAVAEDVLRANGFSYGARATLRREQFPTRVYENVTLEAGVYDALILELGAGKGDNWWCVVYPPLCFSSGGGNIVYKSKIAEIIKKFFA